MTTQFIRAVYCGENRPTKCVIKVNKTSDHKFGSLPQDTYSAGYYERLSDENWNDLPEINLDNLSKEQFDVFFYSDHPITPFSMKNGTENI